MTRLTRLTLLPLMLLTSHAALAADLNIGSDAPPLSVGGWVKGEPVDKLEKGTVYVVEFWATWCAPCRESIPHLSVIQEKFKGKGVVVIGQNVWEEKQDAVAPFVKEMGDKMNYRVAMDDLKDVKDPPKDGAPAGKMASSWLAAAGQDGIPTAFVIDKEGKIDWIGQPDDGLEEVLKSVVEGTFDLKKAVEEAKLHAHIASLQQEVQQHIDAGKWADASGALDELAKLTPDDSAVGISRFQILIGQDNLDGAKALGDQLAKDAKDDSAFEIALANLSLGNKDAAPSSATLALAADFASRANESSKGEDADTLQTLANIRFLQGNIAKAVDLQTEAVSRAMDAESKITARKTLWVYQAALKADYSPQKRRDRGEDRN